MKLRDYGMLVLGNLTGIALMLLIGGSYNCGYDDGKSSAMNDFKRVLKEEYKLEQEEKLYSVEKI